MPSNFQEKLRKQQQWLRLLPDRVILNLATLGPLGLSPKAPGTVGSIGAMALYVVFHYFLGGMWQPLQMLLWVVLIYLGTLICGEAEQRLQKRDPGEIVLDEAVAIPLCFIGLGEWMAPLALPYTLLAGFILFRIFDIKKPFGIRELQRYPGGIGVVLDDVAAGIATCLVLHAAKLGWALYPL